MGNSQLHFYMNASTQDFNLSSLISTGYATVFYFLMGQEEKEGNDGRTLQIHTEDCCVVAFIPQSWGVCSYLCSFLLGL